MRETRDFREGLILLPRLPSPARRATFRTSLASLAHAASAREPVPLEGLDPDALLAGVQAAMSDSLLDNLDWLSTPSAVVTRASICVIWSPTSKNYCAWSMRMYAWLASYSYIAL